eukprot:1526712-Rhodomonas_salina.2
MAYTMSGTEIAYVMHPATRCPAMSGTERAYAIRDIRYTLLRESGTEVAYAIHAATRCPVIR